MRNLLTIFVALLFFSPQGRAFSRTWVDATGKFRVTAELVAVRGANVVLEREDGKIVSLPISRLSKDDQAFLKRQSASAPKNTPAPKNAAAPRETVEKTPPSDHGVSDVATKAIGVLQTHCFRCHGEDGADEGGFDFASDREKLVSAGYVLPRDPVASPLLSRMVSKASPMPPEGESPRPTAAEVDAVRSWIQGGAQSDAPSAQREFFGNDQMNQLVAADLKALPRNDRPSIRYFSTTHLYNAGVSSEELATYQTALAKLLNSLSWNRKLAGLQPVGDNNHLFRIDIRDLKWSVETWNQVLTHYPHGIVGSSREAQRVRLETRCEVPIVRADWFVANASRPPLYHLLAQIPSTDTRLESLLRVNVDQNIRQQRVVRLGFARSGVSQNNRLLERHQSIFGAYWKSYDFAGNIGRKNLFEHPLGPGTSSAMFKHDGGEIIFQLPNGMLAYMLTDESGRRIDRGPVEIVSDPRQPDRKVVNGVSCMSCHHGGFIQKTDEIRRHVVANVSAYRNTDEILGLYAEESTAKEWIDKDTQVYLDALKQTEIGIAKPTRAGEPIVLIANRYRNELDLKQAAAEFGLRPQAFLTELKKLNDSGVDRSVGALKIRGGVIKRESFDQLFRNLAMRIDIGGKPSLVGAAIAKSSVGTKPTRRPLPTREPRPGDVPKGAQDAFQAGVKAMGRGDWKTAEDEFAIALSHSKNTVFNARVYENAIGIYERGEAIEPLLKAHKYLLDTCTNAAEIDQAQLNLFNSLFRFVNKSSLSWMVRPKSKEIDWTNRTLPTSVTNAVASLFEEHLEQDPDHEPSLRVMLTYWTKIRRDPTKHFEVLCKLDEVLGARGERIEGLERNNYAHYHATIGDATKGATLYAEIARDSNGQLTGSSRLKEAMAWIRAKQNDKASKALEIAQHFYERGGTSASSNLTDIGDQFMAIDRADLAVAAYRSALRKESSSYKIGKLQEKAEQAIAMASKRPGAASTGSPSAAMQPMDDLLDPSRQFSVQAKQFEKSASSLPSSAIYNRIKAAESWLKAEETDQAVRVLKMVTVGLRRESKGGSDYEHKQVATLYQQANQPQESLMHWAEAIKRSTSQSTIQQYQGNVTALQSEHPSITIPEPIKQYIDPSYGYRVAAKAEEAKKPYDANGRATNYVKATGFWQEAEDEENVRRAGKLAESAIKQIAPSGSYHQGERLYTTLAETYLQAKLYEQAVGCYVGAISTASQDDKAMKYHQQIKAICKDHGLSVPTLPPDSAKKLDPLNRYRVDAAEKEERAEQATSVSQQLSYWMRASQEWMKAKENKKALGAADRHAALLLKQPDASDYALRRLAEQYEKIGDDQRAIKAYERAIEAASSDYSKKKYQEKINALR